MRQQWTVRPGHTQRHLHPRYGMHIHNTQACSRVVVACSPSGVTPNYLQLLYGAAEGRRGGGHFTTLSVVTVTQSLTLISSHCVLVVVLVGALVVVLGCSVLGASTNLASRLLQLFPTVCQCDDGHNLHCGQLQAGVCLNATSNNHLQAGQLHHCTLGCEQHSGQMPQG